VVASDVLNDAEETQKDNATCSEAAVSEATKGNTDFHNISNIIESSFTSASLSTFVSTSSDMDDIPLNRVYANLQKDISPSTKRHRKSDNDTFVSMYPFVVERIGEMAQRRINACARLLANHPLQPPMIKPLQSISVDAEVVGEPTGPESANHEVSLSPSKPITQSSDPSVI